MTMMHPSLVASAGVESRRRDAWNAGQLTAESGWIVELTEPQAEELLDVTRAGRVEGMSVLEYRREQFPLHGVLAPLRRAFAEVRDGRGVAVVRGLARRGVSADDFELMTWVIGLHFGVARPQDRQCSYLNRVTAAGGTYRSATGRGYNTSERLDFHVDGGDVVLLSSYNKAVQGGQSLCASSAAVYDVIAVERPDLAHVLHQRYPYSRNGEQPSGERAWMNGPIYGFEGGRTFCVWNRNRVANAQALDDVPRLTAEQREAMGYLDAVVRRPDLVATMMLEPGDVQMLSNHAVLHSRTGFIDDPDPAARRLLFRLWLSTPDSPRLPLGWEEYNGTREPGVVRGGITGDAYDDRCRRFERDQARSLGMRTLFDETESVADPTRRLESNTEDHR